jgi:hypothetical protein
MGPVVYSVAPASGTTFGGTALTITGARFSAGAIVIIGGVPATTVTLQDAQTIRATTPAHAGGAVDVTVSVGGQSASLSGAFTYVPPSGTNAPPVVTGITVRGPLPDEPAGLANIGETMSVTASVEDAETPASELEYQWSAGSGTFSGTGASVTWRASGSETTPTDVTLTLTVIEHYQRPGPDGLPVAAENRTTATTTLSLHDSVREAGGVARQFLLDFSDSRISPEVATRNFSHSPRCAAGAADELSDVRANRQDYDIKSHDIGQPSVALNFDGRCSYQNQPGDACINMTCRWTSTGINPAKPDYNTTGDANGTCYLSAVYEDASWLLCTSNFQPVGHQSLTGFLRRVSRQ